MSGRSTYYVTTPIYYVNDVPHIGHAYTTLACDVLARFMRLDGRDVHFLTGTDEHGQKVEKAAEAAGLSPQAFTDKVSQSFRDLVARMNYSPDSFIRTTEKPNQGNNCGYTSDLTCGTPRLWIVGSDGSGAHELFPDGLGAQSFAGWSPDGTLMLYTDNGKLFVSDPNGSEPQPAETGCVAPCEGDSLGSFSSDGT
ncbi:MAG: class I tRNA ligase family protein, partial [Reyranella sp.]